MALMSDMVADVQQYAEDNRHRGWHIVDDLWTKEDIEQRLTEYGAATLEDAYTAMKAVKDRLPPSMEKDS